MIHDSALYQFTIDIYIDIDCARLTLERFSSVGRAPTSATEPSVQLDLESGTICRLIMQPFQTVGGDVFIWSVGPKRNVNTPFNQQKLVAMKKN